MHGVIRLGASERAVRLRPRNLTTVQKHNLLGHCAPRVALKTELRHLNLVEGMVKEGPACEACIVGKSRAKAQKRGPPETVVTSPGERIHMDSAGPFTAGTSAERYAVIVVDEYSGHVTVSMSVDKGASSATRALTKAVRFFASLGHRVVTVRSDNGKEFHGELRSRPLSTT